jgi:hypothetical protein
MVWIFSTFVNNQTNYCEGSYYGMDFFDICLQFNFKISTLMSKPDWVREHIVSVTWGHRLMTSHMCLSCGDLAKSQRCLPPPPSPHFL